MQREAEEGEKVMMDSKDRTNLSLSTSTTAAASSSSLPTKHQPDASKHETPASLVMQQTHPKCSQNITHREILSYTFLSEMFVL